jgi:hypothetical protein
LEPGVRIEDALVEEEGEVPSRPLGEDIADRATPVRESFFQFDPSQAFLHRRTSKQKAPVHQLVGQEPLARVQRKAV